MIKIVGNEIYFNGVLVAKLLDTNRVTVQGDFIDSLCEPKTDYKERYEKLRDGLVGYGDLDYAQKMLSRIKVTAGNRKYLDELESSLSSFRNGVDYMWEAVRNV